METNEPDPILPFDVDPAVMRPINPPRTDDPRGGTITERALRFHVMNPSVYTFALAVCRWLRKRGVKHYSIGAVWEIMRYEYLKTKGDVYQLNNSYRAWYARKLMAMEPDLKDFFSVRDCPNDPDYYTREVHHASR